MAEVLLTLRDCHAIVFCHVNPLHRYRLIDTRMRDDQLEQSVVEQRLNKHCSHSNVDRRFLHNEGFVFVTTDSWTVRLSVPCSVRQAGGFEYLHRDPATPHGRDSNFQTWVKTVKYGHESYGTRTKKWLRWRGPVAIANGRPVLSSERAPEINKPATVRQ
jgi:hypothetical protein